MAGYLSISDNDRKAMLEKIGLDDIMSLYRDVPDELILKELHLPEGMSEMEAYRFLQGIARKNKRYEIIFRGAGAYRHYIPAIVDEVAAKETFLTAYTPYQAEISQGILQSIFEYQTMICELTGMDVSNASVYDGATAAAEALAMCKDAKRNKVLVSSCVNPETLAVMKTYSWASGAEFVEIPQVDGTTDLKALEAMLDKNVAAVYFQQPNFFGIIEDGTKISDLAHGIKAKSICGINPISAALLKTPGEMNCDIAVGEGQPLGMPLAFGGPYLGFMAAKKDMMRKLPGRIVGQTKDDKGNIAYVLTLQAREQHIRREKASSNICSNEALCALRATVYMSAMGKNGLQEVARQCAAKAHYLQSCLEGAGFHLAHDKTFFHEFVTESCHDSYKVEEILDAHGILCGLPLDAHRILWCCTEMNTKEEMDDVARILKEAL